MEKLKAVREQLLQQTAAEGIVGDVRPPLQEGEADLSQPQGMLYYSPRSQASFYSITALTTLL